MFRSKETNSRSLVPWRLSRRSVRALVWMLVWIVFLFAMLCLTNAVSFPTTAQIAQPSLALAAVEITLTQHVGAGADTTVVSSMPGQNYGEVPFLEVGAELTPAVQTETWLWFDLSSIPTGAIVSEAVLNASVQPGGFGPSRVVEVRPALDPWDELSLTWDDHPALDAPAASQIFPVSATVVVWDVTGLVRNWLGTGLDPIPNYGLALQSAPGDDWLRFFVSREGGAPPELVIFYTLPESDYVFSGVVQEVGFGPPEEHPMAAISVTLYITPSRSSGDPWILVDQASTGAQGEYALHYRLPGDTLPPTFTLVIDSPDYLPITALPGAGGTATPERHIQYPVDVTNPGLYPGNVFHVEPAIWRTWRPYTFTGSVSRNSEPAEGVEVVLYGAGDDPNLPQHVLAGVSTAPDGAFSLPVALAPSEVFTTYVLQVADADFQAIGAIPGPGGEAIEANHRVAFRLPEPGLHSGTSFVVQAVVEGTLPLLALQQAAELRPVVVVVLTPRCTCGTATCVTITNTSVLNAFGQTLFNTSGDSVRNYYLENSQGHFSLRQAGLFQAIPMDDPSTSADESTNCPVAGWTSEQHRAYVAEHVLGDQLGFDFEAWDEDEDGVVEQDELIVLLAATDPHPGNARVRSSSPAQVEVGNVGVEVLYVMVQLGTDFYTIAHEIAHTLPYQSHSGEPGDLYNYSGLGYVGAYSVMDDHCHGRPGTTNPNTAYTPAQHIYQRLPHLDPWNKIALGWITPTVITGSGGWQVLDSVETNGAIYQLYVPAHGSTEYFLVESRWPADSQYETQLLDSGLAIWHINESYLPDQGRAINLERASGVNAGGSAICNDDSDSAALWDGSRDFHGSSTPSSDWISGTNSGIAALCIGVPGERVNVYLSASWSQAVLTEDDEEPNNTEEAAAPISLGSYDRNLHTLCDSDVYSLTHWMQVTITASVAAYYDAAYTQPAPVLQLDITEDGFYTDYAFQGSGTVAAYLPYAGVAYIEVSGSSAPVYYRLVVTSTQAVIPPDSFDDQQPPGEPRNDSLVNSAVITEEINENLVLIPGLQIYDLNFETAADQDYFTIQLPPAIHPTSGYSECLAVSDPPTTTQGYFGVTIYPYFKRTFLIQTYDISGTLVTTHTSHGPLEIKIECPHQLFPDGQIVLRLDDPSGQVNFYDLALSYHRWYRVWPSFPRWLLEVDPPMRPPIPEFYDRRARWIYPATPWVQEALFAGVAHFPLPVEYIPFYWGHYAPFTLDIWTLPGHNLDVGLYDAGHNLIGQAWSLFGARQAAASGKRLHVPNLPPGWYALAVSGGEQITEYIFEFRFWQVYLPLVLRN